MTKTFNMDDVKGNLRRDRGSYGSKEPQKFEAVEGVIGRCRICASSKLTARACTRRDVVQRAYDQLPAECVGE